jgi:hypothetical protein
LGSFVAFYKPSDYIDYKHDFFLAGLVIRLGCYNTFDSLLHLSLAAIGPLMPIGLFNRLWYYLIFLLSEAMGIYFRVINGWYWVSTNSG